MRDDAVFVYGLEVSCRIGIAAGERRVARRLVVDLDAALDCRPAALADDIGVALDYAALAETARQVATARQYRLVETLAEALSEAVLAAFPQVGRVRVRIAKRGAVAGAAAVGVVIERRREGAR